MYINGVARALAGMLKRPVMMDEPMYRWPGISLSDYSERGIRQRLLISQHYEWVGNLSRRAYLGQRVIGGVCYHAYGPKGADSLDTSFHKPVGHFDDDVNRMYDYEVQPLCIGLSAAEHRARQFAHLANSPLPLHIQPRMLGDDPYQRKMQDWERKVYSPTIPRQLMKSLKVNIGTV